MSVPTLSDLLVSRTQDEWTAIALAALQGKNFPTTDWTSTSPERAMLETDTACLADQSTQIPAIVQLVLVYYAAQAPSNPPAASDSLQFVAFYWYQITAIPPAATVGLATLTCNSLGGPYPIGVNQLIAISDNGLLYTNTTDGTLATSGTLQLSWQALSTGKAYNIGNNTLRTLQTPLPGVTLNNPGPTFTPVTHTGSGTGTVTPSGASPVAHSWIVRIDGSGAAGVATWSYSINAGATYTSESNNVSATPGGTGTTITLAGNFIAGDLYQFSAPGNWITTQGRDIEASQALALRCLSRWPALGLVPVADKYVLWAREADLNVGRVAVFTAPSVAATVAIYIAGYTGVLQTGDLNQVQAYINVRAGLTDLPVVSLATSTDVTVVYDATYPIAMTGIPQSRNDAVTAYINSAPMGARLTVADVIAIAVNLNAAGVPQGAIDITGVTLNGDPDSYDLVSTAVGNAILMVNWTGV